VELCSAVSSAYSDGQREAGFHPYETNQKLLFDELGILAADKKLRLFDGGHANPVTRPELLGEILAWFDRYLGPVEERKPTP
jgi:hypothetical protein